MLGSPSVWDPDILLPDIRGLLSQDGCQEGPEKGAF